MIIKKQKPFQRGAGALLAVSSLPSPYGIGTFGKAAYDFIDFLERSGQRYWQVLPLGPTSYGDSPYQSFSAFAGNPYFIDLDILIDEGLLKKEEVKGILWGEDETNVDYAALYEHRYTILRSAYRRSDLKNNLKYQSFLNEQKDWLHGYAFFMALKDYYEGKSWIEWPEEVRMRKAKVLGILQKELDEEIDFWCFLQYLFFSQWGKVRAYAAKKNIKIIGDMPIYVALDSADVWLHEELFQLDEELMPLRVAGVPPDMFSATGQLWGNPLYDWDRLEAEDFGWWRKRMKLAGSLYDIVRIDHFVGIAHYFSIPSEDKTADKGIWIDGPGEKLIAAFADTMKGQQIIAEDLGKVTDQVIELQQKGGYPGMKLYQMGFDSDGHNPHLPGFYNRDTIVYGGTHDNDTLAGYFSQAKEYIVLFAKEYLNVKTVKEIPAEIIRTAYASSAAAAIFQIQDYLGLGSEARMNTPSTVGGNWKWRLLKGQLTKELEDQLRKYTIIYGR